MSTRGLIAACFLGTTLLFSSAARAQVELKNDSFVDGDPVGFQSGFVTTEMGAARFTPPTPGVALLKVQILFGGGVDGAKKDVILHVYDDSALEDTPGTELYVSKYALTAADMALQEMTISDPPVLVNGPFRVAIEFTADGLPSIARDSDGTILAEGNFIFVKGGGWKRSSELGVTGDWIIRAFVDDGGAGGSGGAGGGTTTSTTSTTAGTTTGTGGSSSTTGAGGDCNSADACTTGGTNDGCSCRAAGSEPASNEALFAAFSLASLWMARRRSARGRWHES
ncbi:MAG: hypothetical protein ABI193_09010 [Minicystis sp.]